MNVKSYFIKLPYQISRATDSQKCHFVLVAAFKLVYNKNEQS